MDLSYKSNGNPISSCCHQFRKHPLYSHLPDVQILWQSGDPSQTLLSAYNSMWTYLHIKRKIAVYSCSLHTCLKHRLCGTLHHRLVITMSELNHVSLHGHGSKRLWTSPRWPNYPFLGWVVMTHNHMFCLRCICIGTIGENPTSPTKTHQAQRWRCTHWYRTMTSQVPKTRTHRSATNQTNESTKSNQHQPVNEAQSAPTSQPTKQ